MGQASMRKWLRRAALTPEWPKRAGVPVSPSEAARALRTAERKRRADERWRRTREKINAAIRAVYDSAMIERVVYPGNALLRSIHG